MFRVLLNAILRSPWIYIFLICVFSICAIVPEISRATTDVASKLSASRLSKEIVLLEKAMLNGEELSETPALAAHADWAKEVLNAHPEFSADNARSILEQEIGKVFLEVLCDAGVYKRTEEGKAAFMRFIKTL